MKSLIVLTALVFSVSASALESHYGKVSYKEGGYVCSFTNYGQALDFKWVVFNMERRAGKNPEFKAQIKVDQVVGAGESITFSSGLTRRFVARSCKFLAR